MNRLPKKELKKIEKIMKKHKSGSLPKSCYADDGHLYMKEVLRNADPNEGMRRSDKADKKAAKKKEVLKKKLDYLSRHPELKDKNVTRVDKKKIEELKRQRK